MYNPFEPADRCFPRRHQNHPPGPHPQRTRSRPLRSSPLATPLRPTPVHCRQPTRKALHPSSSNQPPIHRAIPPASFSFANKSCTIPPSAPFTENVGKRVFQSLAMTKSRRISQELVCPQTTTCLTASDQSVPRETEQGSFHYFETSG